VTFDMVITCFPISSFLVAFEVIRLRGQLSQTQPACCYSTGVTSYQMAEIN
jgi:hypothetical protein